MPVESSPGSNWIALIGLKIKSSAVNILKQILIQRHEWTHLDSDVDPGSALDWNRS